MCGIAGIVDATASSTADEVAARIGRMVSTLVHRGPDDVGTWVDAAAGVALGFRRLSILDLSPTGRQPMVSASGRYVLVFNGEMYNHAALRAELEAGGHHFKGRSDTEVLLELIAARGMRTALEGANGMFALACWDTEERVLYLARDRFGEKPLYYGWAGRTFLFGSELKALGAHPDFEPSIDRNALALYFRHACVPAPHSIYSGVHKLPPATVLRVDPTRPVASAPEPYWSAYEAALEAEAHRRPMSDRDAADGVEAALAESVGLRMVADVPVGAFLSGGTDSSLVVALMQAKSSHAARTFTIGFRAPGYDEAARARAISAHLGTDHTELYVTPAEAQAVVPRLPKVYDEPFADSSQIPTLLVSELARREVTVALSGDGGDELFGGYTRYAAFERLGRLTRVPRVVRRSVARMIRSQPPRRWDGLVRRGAALIPGRDAPAQPGDKLHKLAGALSADRSTPRYRSLVECWAEVVVPGAIEPDTVLAPAADWGFPAREWAMLADTITYLPDDLLTKVDRASMAVSLEARVPMLDPGVFDLAWRLPSDARDGKTVLRDVLERHLPRELIGGPKTGFGVPFGDWLRGPLRPWAEELLDEHRLKDEGYLDIDAVQVAWKEHCSGRRDRRHELWAVLMFEAWLEAAA